MAYAVQPLHLVPVPAMRTWPARIWIVTSKVVLVALTNKIVGGGKCVPAIVRYGIWWLEELEIHRQCIWRVGVKSPLGKLGLQSVLLWTGMVVMRQNRHIWNATAHDGRHLRGCHY